MSLIDVQGPHEVMEKDLSFMYAFLGAFALSDLLLAHYRWDEL